MRRIVEHQTQSADREKLTIITVFEEGISKRQARLILPMLRYRGVLDENGGRWVWRG